MIKTFLIKQFDRIFSSEIDCSIGDIMLPGDYLDFGQFTVLSRFYDVLKYDAGTDKTFPFQNATSRCLWGSEHDEITGNENFKAIIESYKKNGYQRDFRIQLWRGGALANGTHRVALNIYYGIWEMTATMMWRKGHRQNALFWYLERGLDNKWKGKMLKMNSQVQERLFESGATLSCVTERLNETQVDSFESYCKCYCKRYLISPLDNGCYLLRYSLNDPLYTIKAGKLFSKASVDFYKKMKYECGINLLKTSNNCTDGSVVFNLYRDRIIQ